MSEPILNAVISASNLCVCYGTQVVLDEATVAINERERVGLVGQNGSGKSTFLQIAAGVAEPDRGTLVRRSGMLIGYLPQQFGLDETTDVETNIREGARPVLDLIERYENLAGDAEAGQSLLDRIGQLDGWSIDHRMKSLISHLGAPAPERIVGTLSGGEKRRVALCRALIAQPDFLILDEPTNHLDTESIEWLERFLAQYPGACLFVTHDRYFLDRVATRIIEIARGKFHSHKGSYQDYLEARAAREAIDEQQEKSRQKFLKRELEWIRRGPRARRTKSRDRIDRFYEMAEREGPEEALDLDLIIPPAPRLGNRVAQLVDGGIELGGRVLVRDFNLDLEEGTRIGIVGRNGAGKTTLLRVLLGEVALTSGTVQLGARTKINYVDQGRLLLDEQKSVFEEVGEGSEHVKLGEETISLRAYLRRFLFSEDRIKTKVQLLSGGERSRVILAKILKRGGNLLILDEPTNDLDLGTLRLLEEALVAFGGTVVLVSHDRYFLNRVCTHILAFESDGHLAFHPGNYDRYLEVCAALEATRPKVTETRASGAAASAAPSPARLRAVRKLTWKETQELATIEGEILQAEQEVARIEGGLASPDLYADSTGKWREVEAQLGAARALVAKRYARWEELEAIRAASGVTAK